MSKEAVHGYLALLENQNLAPYTIVARIDELRTVIAAMEPDRGWCWLTALVTRFRRRAKPISNKRSRITPSKDLFGLGLALMEEAGITGSRNPVLRAVRYRDGLMIALLAARPLRVSNLVSIRLGQQLIRQGSGWALVFEPHEMKNRRPFEIPFQQELVSALDTYLQTWRPILLQDQEMDHLWITQYGRPMSSDAAYVRVTKVTLRTLGKSLNPHLFRDCAATSVALEDPEHVRIIAPLLGHSSLSTAERYYNQARTLEAGHAYQGIIQNLRKASRSSRGNRRQRNTQS